MHFELEDESDRLHTLSNTYLDKSYEFGCCLDSVRLAIEQIEEELIGLSHGGPLTFEHHLLKQANDNFLKECEVMLFFLRTRSENIKKVQRLIEREELDVKRPTYH